MISASHSGLLLEVDNVNVALVAHFPVPVVALDHLKMRLHRIPATKAHKYLRLASNLIELQVASLLPSVLHFVLSVFVREIEVRFPSRFSGKMFVPLVFALLGGVVELYRSFTAVKHVELARPFKVLSLVELRAGEMPLTNRLVCCLLQ